MALDKATLTADLITIFSAPSTTDNVNNIAEKMATAIDDFVKTGTVTGTTVGTSMTGGATKADITTSKIL